MVPYRRWSLLLADWAFGSGYSQTGLGESYRRRCEQNQLHLCVLEFAALLSITLWPLTNITVLSKRIEAF